jgi:hypothetical protein
MNLFKDIKKRIIEERIEAQKELLEEYFKLHKDNRHNFMVAKRNTLK